MSDAWAAQYTDPRRYRTWPSEEVIRFIASVRDEVGRTALDLGCGAGGNLWGLTALGFEAYGIDPSPAARTIARENYLAMVPGVKQAPVYHGSAHEIPFPDEFFDVIVETMTMQHVMPPQRGLAMMDCRRVLKPKGRMLSVHLVVPTDYEEVFPGVPPAFIYQSEMLTEEWERCAALRVEREVTVCRWQGFLRTTYAVLTLAKE